MWWITLSTLEKLGPGFKALKLLKKGNFFNLVDDKMAMNEFNNLIFLTPVCLWLTFICWSGQ